jgi:polar amino acid transport system permease protein
MNFDTLAHYGPRMLAGLGVTLELVAISVVLGAVIAVPLALGRSSRSPGVRALTFAYVYFFRGTPLLAQTFLIYYGSGQFRHGFEAVGLWWLFRDAFFCCVLAFTLNTSAYQAEIMRGAIRAIGAGQREAGMALGLTPRQIFLKVIAPQALLLALRPLGNEVVLMVKGSAVAAIVTVFDLMGATRLAYSRTFDISVYLWAAVLYLAVVEVLRRILNLVERRMTRHMRRVELPRAGKAAPQGA